MAMLKGIKEKVHLPLYDSLFVRPRKQLREVESSSVLKFFVNVQGKTKLETNMQSASLLPHWNTFEARALRVVISDLPARFPEAVEKCIQEPNGTADGPVLSTLIRCLEDLSKLIDDEKKGVTDQLPKIKKCVTDFAEVVQKGEGIKTDLDACLNKFTSLPDQQTIGCLLRLKSKFRLIYSDLMEVIKGIRISKVKREQVEQIANQIEVLSDTGAEKKGPGQLDEDIRLCLQAFQQLIDLTNQIKRTNVKDVQACVDALEQAIQTDVARVSRLEQIKACLMDVQAKLYQLRMELRQAQAGAIRRCLKERISNPLIPMDEQIFGNGVQILSKLVYNSVTTFFVGEKIMIQMPTWFFPSGAGPSAADGRAVTHGFPTPEATFRFAEPIFIDTQQNFRVEIEIPEASTLNELQRIYGPFFIWVVLDGYMKRDVQ